MAAGILVVENDVEVARMLGIVIEKYGGRAFIEHSGLAAITKYGNDVRIGTVLADFDLGGEIDGIETLAVFQERQPNVGRVLLTAHPARDEFFEALRTGAVLLLLQKPYALAELRDALGLTSVRGPPSR